MILKDWLSRRSSTIEQEQKAFGRDMRLLGWLLVLIFVSLVSCCAYFLY
jgi:hypothetical protein